MLDEIGVPWWFLVAQLPVAGIVFALDGVLLGAGDAKFMRNATLASALLGFLPLIWLSLVFGWGLFGIWSGLTHVHGVAAGVRRLAGVFGALVGGRNGIVPTGSCGQGTECAAGRRRPVARYGWSPAGATGYGWR